MALPEPRRTVPLTPEQVNAILAQDWGTLHLADGTLIGECVGPIIFDEQPMKCPHGYPATISCPDCGLSR